VLLPPGTFQFVNESSEADLDLHLSNRGALDISRLKNDVGYKPAYDLQRGLAASLPWWRAMIQQENTARGK
jgi:nucleoside-diphosphate-sugar epimerase